MLFQSFEFLVFLPLVFILYWFVFNKNLKAQNFLLLAASYVFYGWWDWRFLSLIIFSSLIDFSIGIEINKQNSHLRKKVLLFCSLVINLGLLGFFKYYNFFLDSLIASFAAVNYKLELNTLNVILPVGISFYTFQTLSYTIDIYKGKIKPTKNLIAFFTFVSFFPQLVAGPIERASHLLPQFLSKRELRYNNFVEGLSNILFGLFKKIVIADRLAIVVNEIYNNPLEYHGFVLIIGTIFFAFQIYCDFSGYSEIAIGVSKLFGFDLMKNFNTPYFSKTLSEFWRRWHISLSTWFRDYLYIPLGGNKTSITRWRFNIFIVFVISGLWHGANWTFIVWGAIHGIGLIVEARINIKQKDNAFFKIFQNFLVFGIVCFGWIFFRANSLADAFYIIGDLLNFKSYSFSQIALDFVPVAKATVYRIDVLLSLCLVISLLIVEWFQNSKIDLNIGYILRSLIYILMIWMIFIFGVFEENNFIYFQF